MDSRLGHYCYRPEYIDDCSKLLDEEVSEKDLSFYHRTDTGKRAISWAFPR